MGFEIKNATTLITGGNTGIGKQTAIELARMGARVVITSRDASRGKLALDEIRQAAGRDDVELIELDLARLSSVRRCAEEFVERFDRLDLLVNNAGVALTRGLRQVTHDGLEMQLVGSRAQLTLWPFMRASRQTRRPPPRIMRCVPKLSPPTTSK